LQTIFWHPKQTSSANAIMFFHKVQSVDQKKDIIRVPAGRGRKRICPPNKTLDDNITVSWDMTPCTLVEKY